jgi:hypothetical protein
LAGRGDTSVAAMLAMAIESVCRFAPGQPVITPVSPGLNAKALSPEA